MGTDNNAPGTPQSQIQKIKETKMTTGLRVKRRPSKTGVMKLASKVSRSRYRVIRGRDGLGDGGGVHIQCVCQSSWSRANGRPSGAAPREPEFQPWAADSIAAGVCLWVPPKGGTPNFAADSIAAGVCLWWPLMIAGDTIGRGPAPGYGVYTPYTD